MEISEIKRRIQNATVVAEEWQATVNRVGSGHYVHFDYEFRIDDNELNEAIELNNKSWNYSEHEEQTWFQQSVRIFVITKILEDGSIELFLSNTKNKEVLNLAMEDTQSEIIDQMLNEDSDYYQEMRDQLDNDESATWCESSCLDISILDILK